MKKNILYIVFLFTTLICSAQSLDSLKHALTDAKSKKQSINLRNQIGEIEGIIRTSYWDSIITDAKNEKYAYGEIYASFMQSLNYTKLTQFEQAVKFAENTLRVAIIDKNTDWQGYALEHLGSLNFSLDEYETSYNYYNQALELYSKQKQHWRTGYIKIRQGEIFQKKNNLNESSRLYREALTFFRSSTDTAGLSLSYNFIGNIFKEKHEIDSSLYYYNLSLRVRRGFLDPYYLGFTLNNLAEIYLYKNQMDSAFYYIKLSEKESNRSNQGATLLRDCYTLYYKYYKAQKKFSEALYYKELSDSLGLKMNNDNTQKAVLRQKAKSDYVKQKLIDDAENEKKLVLEREAKEKQEIITYATVVGIIMLALFLAFVFNRLKLTQKQKEIITLKEQETQKQKEELQEKNHEILQSITYAKRLQQSILPPPRLVKEYMKDSFVLYMPKDIVAGDFYWIESHNNKIYFAAADCTGHGVPGAMVSMVCHNALNRALLEFNLLSPSLILDKASMLVEETFSKSEDNVQDGMDVSLYCLDTATLQLEWAGANNPLWMIQNGEFKEVKADKQPVGRYENRKPFTNHVLQLNEGDSLFSITDGYPDQFGGEQGKKYTYKKLREFLIKINNKPMVLQKDDLIAEFDRWKSGQDQVDDVCIIGVKV